MSVCVWVCASLCMHSFAHTTTHKCSHVHAYIHSHPLAADCMLTSGWARQEMLGLTCQVYPCVHSLVYSRVWGRGCGNAQSHTQGLTKLFFFVNKTTKTFTLPRPAMQRASRHREGLVCFKVKDFQRLTFSNQLEYGTNLLSIFGIFFVFFGGCDFMVSLYLETPCDTTLSKPGQSNSVL